MKLDHDPAIAAVLDELVPSAHERREWSHLLARAGTVGPHSHRHLFRGRRALLALIVLLLAVLVPLTALAVGRGSWFLSAYGPKPVGNVVVVTSGHWQGTPWSLTAFRTGKGTICYAVTVQPATPQPFGSTEACGPVTATKRISFLRSLGSGHVVLSRGRFGLRGSAARPFPSYIVGATISSISQVTIALGTGGAQRLATVAAPSGLHAPVRFFIAQRPASEGISSLSGTDTQGAVVARVSVQNPPAQYRLASPGKQLPLTRAAIHVLRLHRRSPHIYLLASRGGQNFYRLGTSGRCYGTGRSDHLSWNPPSNVLRILGIIECGGNPGSALELNGPVLDLSVYGRTKGQKLMTVYTLAGIASSEVAAVELVSADGVSLQRVPVRDSVYADRPLPLGVVAIAPENAAGVWLSDCGFGKNSLPILFLRC